MGKRTRKQKLRGGFLTKARRGVIGNWWGKCDGMENERLKTRCLLDKERSFYEAHFPDPMEIYEDDAKKTRFKSKIKKKNRPITSKIDKYFKDYSTKELRDAARTFEKMPKAARDQARKKEEQEEEERLRKEEEEEEEEEERLRKEEEKKNLITIQLQTGPYTQNIDISKYATVEELTEKIKNEINEFNLSLFQLYYKNRVLENDSILYDLGIKNKSKLQLQTLHLSNEVWQDANSSTDDDWHDAE